MKRRRPRFTDPSDPNWPNCSVPDCDSKVWCAGGSDKCFPHTHGLTPLPNHMGWKEDISYEEVLKKWGNK